MSADDTALPSGLYELLLTNALKLRLPQERADFAPLGEDMSGLLTQHVATGLDRALRSSQLTIEQRVALCNRLLDLIEGSGPRGAVVPEDRIPTPTELLTAIAQPMHRLGSTRALPRPDTPLSEDALFVNAPHEPGLARELRTELLSADRVDLICAFIVWSGIRIVLDELRAIRELGVPVRVITTTYTGITDPRALDELQSMGAEVRVSYDTRSTRLHAKAWLFHRESGFSTAYIGSSNLTHTALHEGLEWNVRLSQVHSPQLLDRFRAAFDTYWSDEHFVPYDSETFRTAVKRERSSDRIDVTPFDIVPFEYQRAMLDELRVERERHNRWRNLVVAATGTGKTIVAALDYKRTAEAWRGASLLFVAHQQQILEQSRRLFRHVLRDGAFGELLVGGYKPDVGRHVFASVQSLTNIDLENVEPDAYDVIIIDEFHHAEAPTYRRLLDHFAPRLLLGLTATPERADSKDILHWFGGRIAVELRLPEALNGGMLCPFQYFGVSDDVDLSALEWKRRGYDTAALNSLYTGNDLRTGKILRSVHDLIADPHAMRALGFCVSIEHAEYMTRSFTAAGIPSRTVTGRTDAETRAAIIRALRNREINIIFTVDVFNEGIDIPEVDTVLLLRPTESATIFLQQLGRGLRLAEGKSGLTVLDFIGQQRREFRFDARLSALTGTPARKLADAIEEDFPYLPAGCFIHLDRVAKDVILDNIRAIVRTRRDLFVRELREAGNLSLAAFLQTTGRALDELYRLTPPGWMELRRSAGQPTPPHIEGDDAMVRAIGRVDYIDDDERLSTYATWLRDGTAPTLHTLHPREARLLTMLAIDLYGTNASSQPLQSLLDELWRHEAIRLELAEMLAVLASETRSLVLEDRGRHEPLAIHGHYSRYEVLAALGETNLKKIMSFREGVRWVPEANADVFFVTLRKSEKTFSPSTMYHDYAISRREFHWQSQSTTSLRSATGQRYIHHRELGSRVLLFVRDSPEQRSFLYLGAAHHVRHEGDRPISFVWQLNHDIPSQFLLEAKAIS
jgi:superfamily II DNA or RNA helicase